VLAVAAIAAVLLSVALAEDWWRGDGTATSGTAVSVQASLSPGAVQFGDRLTARVVVVIDPARVDASSFRIVPRFLSYRVARATRAERQVGGLSRLSYSFVLECLTVGCAPGRPQVALRFPDAILRFRTRTGALNRRAVLWPSITVASRLDDADRADPAAHLRTDTSPPAVSYRLSPGALTDGLAAASGLLVLAAAVLLFLAFRRTASATVEPQADTASRTPLEDVLLLVRNTVANGNDPRLRRLALQRLVRELRRSDRGELAQAASRLAWSEGESDGEPSAVTARELADRIERELSEER
jgi:hypothetical protein